MIDDFAKNYLHRQLRVTREALVWKVGGLSEYDVRRPLTATGTNLLGLVKHLATWEARYLGEVFGRPFPEPLPRWQDADGSDLWVTPDETRDQILGLYRRAWSHADATITGLPADAPGHVPWWPSPEVKLLREQLDGRTGVTAEYEDPADPAARAAHRDEIERAARSAAATHRD